MKRTLVALVLFLAVFVGSMAATYNIPVGYTVSPPLYVRRLFATVGALPDVEEHTMDTENHIGTKPNASLPASVNASTDSPWEYVSVMSPNYQEVTLNAGLIEDIAGLGTAIKDWFSALVNNMATFFTDLGSIFQNIWYNTQVFFTRVFSKVTSVFSYLYKVFTTKGAVTGYFGSVALALIPLDWQEMQKDGKMPDFSLKKYFARFNDLVGEEWRNYGGHRGEG